MIHVNIVQLEKQNQMILNIIVMNVEKIFILYLQKNQIVIN